MNWSSSKTRKLSKHTKKHKELRTWSSLRKKFRVDQRMNGISLLSRRRKYKKSHAMSYQQLEISLMSIPHNLVKSKESGTRKKRIKTRQEKIN